MNHVRYRRRGTAIAETPNGAILVTNGVRKDAARRYRQRLAPYSLMLSRSLKTERILRIKTGGRCSSISPLTGWQNRRYTRSFSFQDSMRFYKSPLS